MKSASLGERTSAVGVLNISAFGIWLLVEENESFARKEKRRKEARDFMCWNGAMSLGENNSTFGAPRTFRYQHKQVQ